MFCLAMLFIGVFFFFFFLLSFFFVHFFVFICRSCNIVLVCYLAQSACVFKMLVFISLTMFAIFVL